MTRRKAAPSANNDLQSPGERTAFRRRIINWFRRAARPISWRGTKDPYAVWISEIALQQTRVDQGTPYIERLLQRFPTVQTLAAAGIDDVLKLWEGLGYYARARNLHKAAQHIVRDRAGRMPTSAEEWLTIPGVGRYTAGAIASITLDEPAPVLDGNVKRVLARLTDLDASIDDAKTTDDLWMLMDVLVRGAAPGDFNQGMMELGAQICTPRAPGCLVCPVQMHCRAHAAGTVASRPVRRAKAATPHRDIVVAALKKNGRYLVGKRPPGGLLGGLWEFPGGKIEAGEDHATALRRELREELGITATVGDPIATVSHAYSHFRVTLHVYACTLRAGTPKPRAHTELRWVAAKDFASLAFPKANHKFLGLL